MNTDIYTLNRSTTPPQTISFHAPDGSKVAELSWSGGGLSATGNLDDAARMLIDLMKEKLRSAWQPAPTFPTDGTRVLLKTPTGLVEAWYVPAVMEGFNTTYPAYVQTTCKRLSLHEITENNLLAWIPLDKLIGV